MYLEIGPGEKRLGRHWKTLDCIQRPNVDYVARWGHERLPLDDNSCELVYSSHCAEHVEYYKTIDAFREVYRILQPGGWLEVWVPDFAYIVECYLAGRCGDDWRRNNPGDDPMMWAAGRVFAYANDGAGEQNWHRAIFDERHLHACLDVAGFSHIKKIEGHERGHRHGPVSMGARGIK